MSVHTMDELKLTGNALLGSRPVLSFDKVSQVAFCSARIFRLAGVVQNCQKDFTLFNKQKGNFMTVDMSGALILLCSLYFLFYCYYCNW